MLSVVLKTALARWTARPHGRSPNAGDSELAQLHDSGGEGATLLSATRQRVQGWEVSAK